MQHSNPQHPTETLIHQHTQSALFWEELTTVDYAFLDPSGIAWGDSFRLQATLNASHLDEEFVIADFSKMKSFLKSEVEKTIDHVLWVDTQSWSIESHSKSLRLETPFLKYQAPASAFFLHEKEAMKTLEDHINHLLEKSFPKRNFRVQFQKKFNAKESRIQYTHGLKKHDGNCQRILHGHYSPLTQPFTTIPTEALSFLEHRFHGKHLIWKENITSQTSKHLTESFSASQGTFELEIDKGLCVVLDEETTIENLSVYAKKLLNSHFHDLRGSFYFREGLNKGAVVEL